MVSDGDIVTMMVKGEDDGKIDDDEDDADNDAPCTLLGGLALASCAP
jgi:hypothetical protein